jgi:hypothetical protein
MSKNDAAVNDTAAVAEVMFPEILPEVFLYISEENI